MANKALFRFAFWLPYALPLAMLTVIAAGPMTMFYVWGSFHIPANATYDSIVKALTLEVWMFLILLAVPKFVIYFYGKPRPTRKTALLTTTTFLILPILAWLFLSDYMAHIAWILIAFAAWMDALHILFASRVPEKIRTAWHLD